MKVPFTEVTIKHLKPPERGQRIYLDKNGPTGFGIRITDKNARSYVLTYGTKRKRVTLGEVGVVTLKAAKDKARDILAEHQLNGDAAPSITFDAALKVFLSVHCKQNNKPSTAAETERLLTRHLLPTLASINLPDITTATLTGMIDGLLETPSEANHAFTAAKTFFRWAVGRQHISHSPLEALKKPTKAGSRKRVLSDIEIALVYRQASNFGEYGTILRLLLLTGQRLNQIHRLDPDFIDQTDETITWPAHLMKSNEPHTIPLGKLTATLTAKAPFTFNNFSNSKAAFDEQLPIAHWTQHDLRRTFSTKLASLTVPIHVTEKLLAHSSGQISGVAAIYNKFSYLPEMRVAIDAWEDHLKTLLEKHKQATIPSPTGKTASR